MKRGKYEKGDILEIPLPDGRVGYCRGIAKDNIGFLFEIFDVISTKPLGADELISKKPSRKTVAYVNEYSVKKHWKYVGKVIPESDDIPPLFYGDGAIHWTIHYPDGRKEVLSPSKVPYQEMLDRGYIHQVLWLVDDIEQLLDKNQPLKFKPFVGKGA